jgi:hypothetical protein
MDEIKNLEGLGLALPSTLYIASAILLGIVGYIAFRQSNGGISADGKSYRSSSRINFCILTDALYTKSGPQCQNPFLKLSNL